MKLNFRVSLGLLLLSFFSLPSHSADNESPILTVSYHGQLTRYTFNQLTELPNTSITTDTPWTQKNLTFSGVTFKDLLKDLAIKSTHIEIKVTALNNYWSVIPYSDIEQYQPILALTKDGKSMVIRDKGPLWVIYPLSSMSQQNNEVLHSRMVWQVSTLDISDQ
jgi:hypothetical protein